MKSGRLNQIIEMINKQKTVKNAELMDTFGISIETVRRDLEQLEKQGYLRRVYGGAVANVSLSSEPEYTKRAKVRFHEKNAIAAEAAKLVEANDAIYMGVGTTVQAMVQYLKSHQNLTVFTNALRTAVELSEIPECSVILSGGKLRAKELTLSGNAAEENFSRFNVDKAFIGIGGIADGLVTDFHIDEAGIHRILIENARQTIVLTDSGKLGLRTLVNVCPLEKIDIVITNSNAPKSFIKDLEQAGIQVIIAKS